MAPYILIVEDNPESAAPLEVALQSMTQLRIEWAHDGQEAKQRADTEPSSLAAVVTDLNMPRLNGFELIRWLRADPRWPHLPIVVISADPAAKAERRSREEGADAFFAKPYSPLQVCQTVQRLLHEKHPADSALPLPIRASGSERG